MSLGIVCFVMTMLNFSPLIVVMKSYVAAGGKIFHENFEIDFGVWLSQNFETKQLKLLAVMTKMGMIFFVCWIIILLFGFI